MIIIMRNEFSFSSLSIYLSIYLSLKICSDMIFVKEKTNIFSLSFIRLYVFILFLLSAYLLNSQNILYAHTLA